MSGCLKVGKPSCEVKSTLYLKQAAPHMAAMSGRAPVPAQLSLAETTARTHIHPRYCLSFEEGRAVGMGVESLGPASEPRPWDIRYCHSVAPGLSSLYPEEGRPLEALTYLSPARQIPLAGEGEEEASSIS